MSPRNTVIRSPHDIDDAPWFGGSPRGVVPGAPQAEQRRSSVGIVGNLTRH